jgi:uncharacterized protein (DUF1800 family)
MSGSTEDSTDVPPSATDDTTADATARRGFLRALGGAALAGTLVPTLAQAQGKVKNKKPPSITGRDPNDMGSALPRPDGGDPSKGWTNPAVRLARRITMGVTDAEATRAKQLGYDAYLEYQLNTAGIDDSATDAFVAANWPFNTMDVNTLSAAAVDTTAMQNQLMYGALYRSAFGKQQLKERLVEFWSDHFNIAVDKAGILSIIDQRDVIRQYAMTTFPQLVKASAHSPAMLVYLDQQSSTKNSPNQNYAREIMELHTLGVDGGYTQTDVAELSRVLTGWTIAGRGVFNFNPALHDFGAKTVMGMTIPATSSSVGAAAIGEGESVIDMLLTHPSTASFVSKKMLRYFLRYDPSPAQIAAVAAVYTSTKGDIKAMLRAVLSQANVTAAPAKYKRPYHLVVSAVRALGPTVTAAGIATLNGQVFANGHQLFDWQTPDGYPDTVEYWCGSVLPRWNFGNFLANANTATTVQFNVTPLMTPATAANIVNQIDKLLFVGEMPQRLRDQLTAYVTPNPTSQTLVRETVMLALSSSAFQYY